MVCTDAPTTASPGCQCSVFASFMYKAGAIVNRRYLIVRQIAQGAHGATYEGIDRRSRQRVVVKHTLHDAVFAPNGQTPPVDLLLQQIATLDHPALPAAIEYFSDTSGHYLISEFISGEDLGSTIVQRNGVPFSTNEVLAWATQLLDALAYLHQRDVPLVHGDIKPHNLKVTPSGQLKLLDIGGARRQPPDLAVLTVTSGLDYLAPEQLIGQVATPQSDLFSLGATLYYLLSGEAFPNAIERGIARALAYPDPLPPLDEHNPQVAPDIAQVFAQLLAYLPRERYTTARQVQLALSEQQVLRTVTVAPDGSGNYTSIMAAVHAARPGERIIVHAGTYHETVILDHTVSLVADDSTAQVIINTTDAPCIVMQTERAEVRGFVLQTMSSVLANAAPAVEITMGELLLEQCRITSYGLAGVAIYGAGVAPTLRNCEIIGGAQAGIDIYEQASPIIERCEVRETARAGIEVSAGATPLIRNCTVHHGESSGIYVFDGAHGTIENCTITDNRRSGVSIAQEATPLIRGCTIRGNGGAGIFAYRKGHGTVENCQIAANGAAGIEVKDHSDPHVRRCTVRDGRAAGIYVHALGAGEFEDCDIAANAEAGVAIVRGGAPHLTNCRIQGGSKGGLWVAEQGEGVLEGCEIRENRNSNVTIAPNGNPLLRRCHLRNSHDVGLQLMAGAQGQFEDCTLTGSAVAGIVIEGRTSVRFVRCIVQGNNGPGVQIRRNSSATFAACDLRHNNGGPWVEDGRHQVQMETTVV